MAEQEGDAPRRKRRASRTKSAATSVVVLPLCPTAAQERQLNSRFSAGFSLYRTAIRYAQMRLDALKDDPAYLAAKALPKRTEDECKARAKALTKALTKALAAVGLSEQDLVVCARGHRTASKWMVDHGHIDSQVAGLLGTRVWKHAVAGFLFGVEQPDGSRKFTGFPKLPTYFEFTTLPGKAQQISAPDEAGNVVSKWESITLAGTLEGHRTDPNTWPAKPGRGWGRHTGRLMLVWSPCPGDAHTLALPVRLPGGPAAQARWEHYLSDRNKFVKVDLVRKRVLKTVNGVSRGAWQYFAHLTVLAPPFRGDRYSHLEQAPDRQVGIDLGPSLAAFAARDLTTDAVVTHYHAPSEADRAKQAKRARGQRQQARRLDRQRRAANPDHYQPGKQKPQDPIPRGERKPEHAKTWRADQLTGGYRNTREQLADTARKAAEERQRRANELAKHIVTTLGPRLVVERCALVAWQKQWGKSILNFAPGMLLGALKREAELAGGGLTFVSTRTTRLSRTCACGTVKVKELSERTHTCTDCGLGTTSRVDRDLFSALLAACTTGAGSDAALNLTAAQAAVRVLTDSGQLDALAGPSPARREQSARRTRTSGKTALPRYRANGRSRRAHSVTDAAPVKQL